MSVIPAHNNCRVLKTWFEFCKYQTILKNIFCHRRWFSKVPQHRIEWLFVQSMMMFIEVIKCRILNSNDSHGIHKSFGFHKTPQDHQHASKALKGHPLYRRKNAKSWNSEFLQVSLDCKNSVDSRIWRFSLVFISSVR